MESIVEHTFFEPRSVAVVGASRRIMKAHACMHMRIKKSRISQVEDTVAVAHHAYPCTASMDVDPKFNEPILHIAG